MYAFVPVAGIGTYDSKAGMSNQNDEDRDIFEELNEDDIISSQESVRFEDSNGTPDDSKVFNDPIHGHIMLHPLCIMLIDTPQFQRLRQIKQLGSTYFVYPGASHNRFEHCIGVCYLAEKLARMLQEKQKNLGVTDKDVLCVAMAGLCHDLGHGPFSHMFDDMFLRQVQKDCVWTHEKGSCMMFDHIIEDNGLKTSLEKYEISERDIIFVKEMIAGPLGEGGKDNGNWPYLGRGEEKSFLYEIVSNDRNKVDVDKWDYFARDCYHLGISNSFDHNRFMQFIKVLRVEGERLQICARDKECLNLYEMFHTRSVLHKRAYRHRVGTAIDMMICKALIIAEPYIKILGRDNKPCSISECIGDPVAFTKLNDNIFDTILYSSEPELKAAREILLQIQKRELYKCIGVIRDLKLQLEASEIPSKIISLDESKTLVQDDIVANSVKIDYGMRDQNPVDSFRFFSKSNPTKPYHLRRDDVSEMLPSVFQDKEIEIFCTDGTKVAVATKCFEMWSDSLKIEVKYGSQVCDELTPYKRQRSRADIAITKRAKLDL